MTEINFKGKAHVYAHHLSVPFKSLNIVPEKSLPPKDAQPSMDDNLIIHGDNLHALKALLPQYAGKVDCIFIDPPYNTGNEGWCYNDKVNSPLIREWLKREANPVDKEDLERHDKWCAMMWPRLKLLHELLADTGSFWMTLDDNEAHRGKLMLDEIFGEENFVGEICWNSRKSKQNDAQISVSHNYIIAYIKNSEVKIGKFDENESNFFNPDGDPRGPWTADPFDAPNIRKNLTYEIVNPNTGDVYLPPKGRCWRTTKGQYEQYLEKGMIVFGKTGKAKPQLKRYLADAEKKGKVPDTWWDNVGTATEATQELQKIFKDSSPFDTPKPVRLLSQIMKISLSSDALILDSFAGSGTTAHAVLQANKLDNGTRKFIMVEMEDDIADDVTAERVRRVIKGYEFTGEQKTELHREKLTYSKLKKGDITPDKIEEIVEKHGERYDRITGEIKDSNLVVYGEDTITEKTKGLGGSFTYCELGAAFDIEQMLKGNNLPDYQELAKYVF
jgi:adenine-specific DNA-methyltransferase